MQRISVDLPEPDGPQTTMRSPAVHFEVDVRQHLELAVPLLDPLHADDDLGVITCGRHDRADAGLSMALVRSRVAAPRWQLGDRLLQSSGLGQIAGQVGQSVPSHFWWIAFSSPLALFSSMNLLTQAQQFVLVLAQGDGHWTGGCSTNFVS